MMHKYVNGSDSYNKNVELELFKWYVWNQRWKLLFLQHKEALTTKKENNHIWPMKYCSSLCQTMEWQFV